MIFTETKLKGAFLIDIERITDDRGFFGRSWDKEIMEQHGMNIKVVQSNISFNHSKGTLRGMHFQKHPYEETKLVRCTKGAVYDVIIDLRTDSKTYKQWIGAELTGENHRMIYVPEGFAHGYLTLEDNCEVNYLVTQFYTPGSEGGIRWNDPEFDIEWPSEVKILSEKDKNLTDFDESKLILEHNGNY